MNRKKNNEMEKLQERQGEKMEREEGMEKFKVEEEIEKDAGLRGRRGKIFKVRRRKRRGWKRGLNNW